MEYVRFKDLYLMPSSNGLSRPSAVRGKGFRMIGMGELFACNIIHDMDMERVLMNEKEQMKYFVQEGDLLFARQSLVAAGAGKCSIVSVLSEKTTFESHIIRVRLNKKICNPLYYFYLFQLPYNPIKTIVNQCAQAGIRGSELCKIKVQKPSLSVQNSVSCILGKYDTLIENNTKRIRLLEKMAENLYKEWFVRFRFPGHENVEMENGLPKGWKVKKYEDELNVKYGKGLPTDKLTKDGFPVFGSNGQIGYYTSYMYDTPQILISCRGASSGVVNISLPKSFITNNSLICEMTNKTESVFEYLKYYFLNTNLVQYQTGSAQPQITINNIVKLKLLIPSTDIQIKFADKVRTLDKEVGNLQLQNSLLARQRDLLLPRLMSGKLEVKEELLE